MSEQLNKIEERLTAANIAEFEIYLIQRSVFEHQFIKRDTDITKEGHAGSYNLRILDQKDDGTGIGIVRSSSFRSDEIDNAIQQAKAVAGLNNEKTYSFPSQSPRYSEVVTLEDEVKEDPLSALQNQTELLSTTVQNLQAIPTFGKLRLIIEHKFLRNSNQIDLEQAKNHWFLEYALKSETENKKAEYWGETYAARAMDLDLANRISTWDTYAMEALTAEPPTVSPDEIIIFPPNVITQAFVPVIAHHASANARLEGTSNFDEIGKQVAQSDFTIWDDGLLEGGLDTAPWDGEGLPQQATPIISDGVFQNWLYDQRHALIYNVDSTGNGVRGRTGQIVNDIHNLKSSVGSGSFEDLLKDVDHGLLINQFSWLNPSELSGSFGAEIRNGYEIEEGALTKPVKGGVVSGNIFAMLKDISGMTSTTQIAPARDGTAGGCFPWMAFKNLKISK